MSSIPGDKQRDLTNTAIAHAGLRFPDVWLRYFSITGAIDEYEVDAYLNRLIELPAFERDLVSYAVNELIDELPHHPRAPYSYDHHPESAP